MTDRIDTPESVPDGRQPFVAGPRRSVPGLAAFLLLMVVLALALIGFLAWHALHPKAPDADQAGSKRDQTFAGALPIRHFTETPASAVPTSSPEPASAPATSTNSAAQGQQQASPEELANMRRLAEARAAQATPRAPAHRPTPAQPRRRRREARRSSASARAVKRSTGPRLPHGRRPSRRPCSRIRASRCRAA